MATLRTAYLTGASSGIGAELARVLAARGTHLVLAARRVERLEALAEEIRTAGGTCDVAPVDVGDAEAARAEVLRWDDALSDRGGLDAVIANAGVGHSGPAPKLRWEQLEQTLLVNAVGAIAALAAGCERMHPRGRGTLVGVSSLAAYRGLPTSGAYAASKACLSTYLEALRIDLAGSGVRVVDVRPGFIRTEMTDGARHPMPFLMDVEPAARKIARGIERGSAQIAFPWPLWWALACAQAIPNAAWRLLAPLVRPPR